MWQELALFLAGIVAGGVAVWWHHYRRKAALPPRAPHTPSRPTSVPPRSPEQTTDRYVVKFADRGVYSGHDLGAAKLMRRLYRRLGHKAVLYVNGVWRG